MPPNASAHPAGSTAKTRPSRRVLVATGAAAAIAAPAAATDRFAAIEARTGGRLGVAAFDVAGGTRLAHRADERFPMCSTFKAMAAAAVLSLVDRGVDHLDRVVPFGRADLLAYAPVASAAVDKGGMTLGDLCAAAIEMSDNTAANLVLAAIGGPAGWTGFVRTLGDAASRLDRTEPMLNAAVPGDPRDTTTPLAMVSDLRLAVLGKVLSPSSRDRLAGWMTACTTGQDRLRAGLPPAWRIGDKTGSGDHGTCNDIAVVWTPTGPILIAAYLTGADRVSGAERDAALAEAGRIVAQTLRPMEANR